jgi:hypothetical protein
LSAYPPLERLTGIEIFTWQLEILLKLVVQKIFLLLVPQGEVDLGLRTVSDSWNTSISSFLSRTCLIGIVLGVVGVEEFFHRFQILEEVGIISTILVCPLIRYVGIKY